MTSVFEKLFPEGLLKISQDVIQLKNKLDSCVPKRLEKQGYLLMTGKTKNCYFNPQNKILLFY